jgi:hypothetical protein
MFSRMSAAMGIGVCWAALAAIVTASLARAQSHPYELSQGADFEWGCFGNCGCGAAQAGMTGGFWLQHRPPAASFTRYDVRDLALLVQLPYSWLSITGSGTYRVGGTSTIQQQLTLDVSFGGGPLRHLDSGLVPGGGDFPRLDVALFLHGAGACTDTMLRVRAGPAAVSVAPGNLPTLAPSPNPFRSLTRIELDLPSPGPVRAVVFDASGRLVRTLVDRVWMPAGLRSLAWDGRGETGEKCAPGRYFVHVRAGDQTGHWSVVKLE